MKKKLMAIAIAFIILLFMAVSPVSADVQTYNPVKEQERTVLIEQIHGTDLMADQYLQTVWPEIYQKISSVDKAKLASINKVWELKDLNTTPGGTGIFLTLNDPQAAERFALMDAVENLDISEAEYMQIVWPELYADLDDNIRSQLAVTPNQRQSSSDSIISAVTRAANINVNTNIWQQNQYLKFNAISTVTGVSSDSITYNYVEGIVTKSGQRVGSTAYNKYQGDPTIATVVAENMIAWPDSGTYVINAYGYATLISVGQISDTDSASTYFTRP